MGERDSIIRVLRGAAVVGLCSAGVAWADPPPSTPADGAHVPPAAAQKLICKKEPVIGSNIPKRVCRTQAQIDAEREASRDSMSEMNQRGHVSVDGRSAGGS